MLLHLMALRRCPPSTHLISGTLKVGKRIRNQYPSLFACVSLERSFSTRPDSTPPPTQQAQGTGKEREPSSIVAVPDSFWSDLQQASEWKSKRSDWKPEKCREVVSAYDNYLKLLLLHHTTRSTSKAEADVAVVSPDHRRRLLSPETVTAAFKVLLKCRFPQIADLATTVRNWERHIGRLGETALTDHLSLRLLTANAKAGNLGRCLSLLELRQNYSPRRREFYHVIRSIAAARKAAVAATAGRKAVDLTKNIFLSDLEQPILDNPTRWLDAILIHMKERNFPLTTALANSMLRCYSGAGYTGKASHHFFRVVRNPVETTTNDSTNNKQQEQANSIVDGRPKDWYYVPELGEHAYRPTQVTLKYNQQPPPFYKVPAQVRGKLLTRADGTAQFRLERETEPDYSVPLAAAFAFADSLQHGACGHDPIVFNIYSYNALIKACVFRGALWRAMHILDVVIPHAKNRHGERNTIQPNTVSYNLILYGLARVGDVVTAQEYFLKMNAAGLSPDAITVRAIVDGLLNLGDAPAAVTVVQDFFNQHSVLPPYTTLCKILEFCLARGMVFEAKRFVYFIQQLWYWEPVKDYHKPAFIRLMRATQKNTQLQKPALQKMFAYFGETLTDADFL